MTNTAQSNAPVEPWLLEVAQEMIRVLAHANRGELSFTFAGHEQVRVRRVNGKGLIATFLVAPDQEGQS